MSTNLYAYLTKYSDLKGKDLHAVSQDELTAGLHFSTLAGMTTEGWIRVGTAQVVVTLDARQDVIRNAVAGLRKQQQTLRANTEREVTAIEKQINSLLCIEGAAQEVEA